LTNQFKQPIDTDVIVDISVNFCLHIKMIVVRLLTLR